MAATISAAALGSVTSVARNGAHLCAAIAQRCCRLFKPLLAAGANGQLAALACKPSSNTFANAATGAGDEGNVSALVRVPS